MDALYCLKKMTPKLPKAIGSRFKSTFKHIELAENIFDLDREMASFRAITAEEEAATALMMALQTKRYPGAKRFNPWNHNHKAAVLACVMAIARSLQPILQTYQAIFQFDEARIDIKVPLSNFGVEGGQEFGLQFVEPLGMLHTRDGLSGDAVFREAIEAIANGHGFENAKVFIREQANARNTLLYATDTKQPESKATKETIERRKNRALVLLSLSVMVLQAKRQQPMVTQAIPAFLYVISKTQDSS